MNFEDYWKERWEGSSNGRAIAEDVWECALEEAAKVAEKELSHLPALAQEVRDQIRNLKTKE